MRKRQLNQRLLCTKGAGSGVEPLEKKAISHASTTIVICKDDSHLNPLNQSSSACKSSLAALFFVLELGMEIGSQGRTREREKFSKYSSNWSNPKCSDCLTLVAVQPNASIACCS